MRSRRSLRHVSLVASAEDVAREVLTEIDDELDDLETGDPFLPPAADATGTLEVVPVHDHVDGQVQGDYDPRHGGATQELSVAEDRSRAMVVAVQEGCRPVELAGC